MDREQRLALALRRRACQELINAGFTSDVHHLLRGSVAPKELAGLLEQRGKQFARAAHDIGLLEGVELPETDGIVPGPGSSMKVVFGQDE